tara:strand:+ start:163 stop:399 length:237 start_codon:yes stop_codon:yes gene_type:complete
MKKKFIIIGLAMGSLGFSQDLVLDSLSAQKPLIFTVDTLQKTENKITSVQCSGTSKSTGNRCKLRTRHESEQCHHHRN